MNNSYIATVMSIIRKNADQGTLLKDIQKRVYDITRKNSSHLPEFMKEGCFNVTFVNNGKTIETSIEYMTICYIEGEGDSNVDIDDDTAYLIHEYDKREETISTLETILYNQNKSSVLAELPELAQIFNEADRKVKAEKERKEQKWTLEVAAIKDFLAS